VLQRDKAGDAWTLLGDEHVRVVHEGGVPYVRAKIDHFSQGCLARNILLDDAVLTER
ncbi:unnamed protein product, partial [Ectocarpus fasciculatus]